MKLFESSLQIVVVALVSCAVVTGSNRFRTDDKLIFLQLDNPEQEDNRLLVVTWSPETERDEIEGCEVFRDQKLIEELLKSSSDPQIRSVSEKEMEDIIEDCAEVTRRRRRSAQDETDSLRTRTWPRNRRNRPISRRFGDRDSRSQNDNGEPNNAEGAETTTEGYSGLPVIFPGTKWCGAGDIAKNYDDLGFHADTDKCCRAHDKCDDLMAPGETKNNLTNKSAFTKLSCKCDDDFYNCLNRVDSMTSNTVGNMYFNVLDRECYAEDYPDSDKCKTYTTFLKIRCKEYEKDTSVPKAYQWKKGKLYKKIPFPGPFDVTLPF